MKFGVEAIGTAASFLVLLSWFCKGERNIRRANIAGAIIFVVYGVISRAFSVWFMNACIIILQAYKLLKQRKTSKKERD